jgi:Uncharacterised nucleotidyltransferase
MADFPEMPQIRDALRQPLRRVLGGEGGPLPPLGAEDVAALGEHGVGPLVYSIAHAPQLREDAIRAAALEHARCEDLREVLAALHARGIDVLITKGSALAYDLYPQPELRPRGDTDLFIAPDDLDSLREAMRAIGAEERTGSGDEHGLRQALFKRGPHAYDVHWAVANSALFADVIRFGEARSRARALPALSEHARGLSHVDALLLACIHRVAHHHDTERLIWLYDIALLRERMTREEHALFWQLAAERGVVGVCMRSIALADEWCNRAPRFEAHDFLSERQLRAGEPSRAYLDREMTYGRMMLSDLGALPWRLRMRRLWQLAVPPRAFMRERFPRRGRLALPWLYVYRGARGLARLFRRA